MPEDAAPGRRRGWCPTLHEPMASGDGLLLRVKPRAGRLDAAAAHAVADAASRHGNGVVELTARANLQLRGLTPASAQLAAASLLACGAAEPSPAAERRRNVVVSPLAGDDPTEAGDPLGVARALETRLAADPSLAPLPGKFGFAVDGGGLAGLAGLRADVTIETGDARCRLGLDGAASRRVAVDDAVDAAIRVARVFLRRAPAAARRMRDLVAAAGIEAVLREAGLGPAFDAPHASPAPAPVGFLRYPGRGGAFGMAPRLGVLEAGALGALARLACRHGDGLLRMTPWRTLLLGGVAASEVAALAEAALSLGMVTNPRDPLLGVAACPGAPSCPSASVRAREDAAWLAASAPPGLHVSGCAKGCAHPAPAAVTLVGEGGSYALVRNGRASDPPLRRGLTVEAAAALLRGAPGECGA